MRHAILATLLFLFSAVAVKAQVQLTASDSGACTTANACLTIPVGAPNNTASLSLNGTFSATAQFEVSGNGGISWSSVSATPTGGGSAVTSATTTGTWQATVSGLTNIRIRLSAFTSGPVGATINLSTATAVGSGGSPTGAAGGALGCTYPNPCLASTVGVTGQGAMPLAAGLLAFSNQCPTTNTGNCFYTYANTVIDNTCSWAAVTGTTLTVTCSDGPFTAAMASASPAYQLWGYNNANGGTNGGCNPTPVGFAWPPSQYITTTHTTITGYTSATQVTVSTTTSTVNTSGGCVIFGQPDDAGAAALWTAANASASCPHIDMQAGYYMFTTPPQFLYANPAACLAAPFTFPNGAGTANMIFAAGYHVSGRGPGTTILTFPPDFPQTGSCNKGYTGISCLAVPVEATFDDFSVMSGGSGGFPTSGDFINVDIGTLENFTAIDMGLTTGGSATDSCILVSHWAQLRQININSCGANGIEVQASADPKQTRAYNLSIENVGNAGIRLDSGGITIFGLEEDGGYGSSNNAGVINRSGTFVVYGFNFFGQVGAAFIKAYSCQAATCTAYINGANLGDGITNVSAIYDQSAGIDYLSNVKMNSGSSGFDVLTVSGGTIHDGCGNSGTRFNVTANTYLGEGCSYNTNLLTAAKLVLSAGWGSTAAVTVPVGANFPISFTITNSGTGQGASPTITYTFPNPLPVAPISCTATDAGGTNPLLNPFTTSSLTATGVVFTATGTPTVSDTEFMQVNCVTP